MILNTESLFFRYCLHRTIIAQALSRAGVKDQVKIDEIKQHSFVWNNVSSWLQQGLLSIMVHSDCQIVLYQVFYSPPPPLSKQMMGRSEFKQYPYLVVLCPYLSYSNSRDIMYHGHNLVVSFLLKFILTNIHINGKLLGLVHFSVIFCYDWPEEQNRCIYILVRLLFSCQSLSGSKLLCNSYSCSIKYQNYMYLLWLLLNLKPALFMLTQHNFC